MEILCFPSNLAILVKKSSSVLLVGNNIFPALLSLLEEKVEDHPEPVLSTFIELKPVAPQHLVS